MAVRILRYPRAAECGVSKPRRPVNEPRETPHKPFSNVAGRDERGYASAVGSELPVAACPRRRLHAARPTKAAPVPKSSKVAGSGTGA